MTRDAERHKRLALLFERASELPADERDDWLSDACEGDAELLARVHNLLEADERSRASLDRPVVGALGEALSAAIASASAHSELPHPERLGPYRILSLLGQGGMGIVYEAEQESPRRRVALKVIRPGAVTPAMLRRFEQETLVLGRLNHPGIAQIYDAGAADAGLGMQPYIAMELVRGVPLTNFAERVQLDPRGRIALIAAVADAVQHAHDNGVVHRDLKPANVLVDGTGAPKVLDFGVAHAALNAGDEAEALTALTAMGEVLGTLSYMSPEQVNGENATLDARSDVYSLGVLAHELLSGQQLFDLRGKRVHEAARIIVEEEPTTLGGLDRALRGDVETIVVKALEKEPERRYPSAAAFAADLRRFLRDEPIVARAPSAIYQLTKYTRRNRAVVAGIAGVILALAAGLAVSLNLYRRSESRGVRLAAALGEADLARSEAQASLGESEATVGFLTDMLEQASPDHAERDLTVLELLQRMAPEIDSGFADRPRVALRLHNTAVEVFEGLSALPEAIEHSRHALELAREVHGPDSEQAITTSLNLGQMLSTLGELEEAEPWLTSALERSEDLFGAEDRRTARCKLELGKFEKNRGNLERAEELLLDALAVFEREAQNGSNHGGTLNALAIVQARRGAFAEAKANFELTLDMRLAALGGDHPLVLEVRNNLATLLTMQGDAEAALALDLEILATRRRVLGPDHLSTLGSQHGVALSYNQLGRPAEAEPLLREAIAGFERVLGPTHINALNSTSELCRSLQQLGRVDEAHALYLEALERAMEGPGESHWVTIQIIDSLGTCLHRLGRIEEGIERHRRAVELSAEHLGAASPTHLIARASLSHALDEAGDSRGALEQAELAYEGFLAAGMTSHRSLKSTRTRLAQLHLRVEPEQLRDPERALELATASCGEPDADAAAFGVLAAAQVALGREPEALTSFDRALELMPADSVERHQLQRERDQLAARVEATPEGSD